MTTGFPLTPFGLVRSLASLTDSSEKTLAEEYRGTSSQYWIVVREGLVEQIDEQYVP